MADNFSTFTVAPDSPAVGGVALTKSDTTTFDTTRGIYVGGAGNAVCVMANGTTVTFTGMLAGMVYPVRITALKSTNTTVSDVVALY